MSKLIFIVGATVVIVAFGCSELAAKQRLKQIPNGSWGGPHIRIEVHGGSATIEYDCANGAISGPLKLDRNGRFKLSGTHVREHPGPIRVDEPTRGQAASYTGRIEGKKMTLVVTLTDKNEQVGTFTLELGGPGRVFKCR